MPDLLREILCGIGGAYLAVRVGRSLYSIVKGVTCHRS
jgi:hypothetical protein